MNALQKKHGGNASAAAAATALAYQHQLQMTQNSLKIKEQIHRGVAHMEEIVMRLRSKLSLRILFQQLLVLTVLMELLL